MMSSPSSFDENACLYMLLPVKKHTKTSRVFPVTPNDLLIPFVNLSSPSFHTKLQWVKALLPHQSPCQPFSSWWFQPIWKICSSNRILSPNFEGKQIKHLWNPPPIVMYIYQPKQCIAYQRFPCFLLDFSMDLVLPRQAPLWRSFQPLPRHAL